MLPSADVAPTGRAKCIHCGEALAKGTVRIAVERVIETGALKMTGAGFMHPHCAAAWAVAEWPAGIDDLIAKVKANTAVPGLPPPFGDAAIAAPPAEAPKKTRAKKAPAVDAAPTADEATLGFGALSGKDVVALVAKLGKLKELYKSDAVFEKAGIDHAQRDPLRWHIARHGLLPATHPVLLYRLSDSAIRASADDVFGTLAALARPATGDAVEVLPGWAMGADLLIVRALELDPARLEAALEGATPLLRRGIQFVRGRSGATIPEDDRREVLEAIAVAEATKTGLPRTWDATRTWLSLFSLGDGKRSEPFATGRDLALRFGTAEAWVTALARAAKSGKFTTLDHVADGLVALTLPECVEALAKASLGSSDEKLDRALLAIVTQRDDDPRALIDQVLKLPRTSTLRDALLLHGIGRLAERGQSIPEGLEREVRWESFLYSVVPWRGSAVWRIAQRKALEALPRERALPLIESYASQAYQQSIALSILSVHFDDVILERILTSDVPGAMGMPELYGPIGAPALPRLVRALEAAGTDAKARKPFVDAITAVLAFLGATGQTFDASFDSFVSCAPSESYWSSDAKTIFVHAIRGIPEPRRIALLERLLVETKQIERPFLGVATVASPEFRAKAARQIVQGFGRVQDSSTFQEGVKALGPTGLAAFRAPLLEDRPDTKIFETMRFVFGHAAVQEILDAGKVVEEKKLARLFRLAKEWIAREPTRQHERIYLLERRDLDDGVPARRAGSFSVSRGAGPGGVEAGGEREHVVTIDLEEVPELQKRHPSARALSLFAKSPQLGDGWKGARLLSVPRDAAPPTGGNPITVMPIDVPSSLFDSVASRDDAALKEIRQLVFNRPGYVLGEPMYIQQDDEGSVGFVMQLAESIGDLNLGDSGSLYVFEGASFMQCY